MTNPFIKRTGRHGKILIMINLLGVLDELKTGGTVYITSCKSNR